MRPRDNLAAVRHMLEHAREARDLIHDISRDGLDQQRVIVLALLQLLQIIGEAAGRVSDDFCAHHPEIPWSQIVALRNRLIHGYDVIDFDIVWTIVSQDLPQLIAKLEQLAEP